MELRFELGTLLLENPPPGLDSARLPGAVWDPDAGAYRAPAAAYSELRAALRDADIEFVDSVAPKRRPVARWKQPRLSESQKAALDAWRLHGRRGTIVVPAGATNTCVAIAAIARERRTALCLVPTRVALEQWCSALQELYPGRVGCYGNGVKRLRSVTVSTYAGAERYMERFGDRFDLLIADAVHIVADGLYADAFLMSSATARLGLTATPPARPDLVARLSELVGPVVASAFGP